MATWKAGLLGVLVTFIGVALLIGAIFAFYALLIIGGPWAYVGGMALLFAVLGWFSGASAWGHK